MRAGQIVALVGLSGAGKTTLVNLIPRFYDVTEGAILIDGVDIRDVTLASLREQIALVTQETVLFDDTIAANIAYGVPGAAARESKRRPGPRTPTSSSCSCRSGYEARIGERGQRLSGGQRQRLAIARAILKDSPLLVLDEATSSLDAESELLVQDALVEPDAEPDDVRDRPPALDRAPRRLHHRARKGPRRRDRHARRARRRVRAASTRGCTRCRRSTTPAGNADRGGGAVVIRSMTGFAAVSREEDGDKVNVTVKSVNHRFLDMQIKAPQSLARSKRASSAVLQQRLTRGRVEVSLFVERTTPPLAMSCSTRRSWSAWRRPWTRPGRAAW